MRVLPLVFLLAACPSNHDTPVDAAHNDAPKIIDAAIDAKPDAALDAAGPKGGFVSLVIQHESTTTGQASAQFTDGFPLGSVIGTDGACTIYGNQPTSSYSAGVLTVTGTTQQVTMTPGGTAPNVHYTSTPDPLPAMMWNVGATITVSAAGSTDIPQFSTTLTGVAPLVGWTPPASLSRSAGYQATWTAGTGPKVWVIVEFLIGQNDFDAILCKVDDNGSFKVQPTAFAQIPASSTQGVVVIARVSESDVGNVSVQAVDTSHSGLLTVAQ